ncbi:MAG: GDSL-type esterase/lipase family protein [Bacteroidota bacterium]|nr:GDSL-type esterase/lipase family protein [Bacteroidota bacterium]
MIIKRTYGLLYLIVFNWGLNAQHYPHAHQQYSFIDISKNRLEVFNDKKWQNFIGEIHHQWQFGGNDINIIHFGGSHIQADVWTNRMRQYFQHISPYNGSGRGMYFPFRLIKSNGSPYLKTKHDGNWKGYRNSVSYHEAPFGLLGARAELIDSVSTISFYVNKEHCTNCHFNRIDFLHEDSLDNHCIQLMTDSVISIETTNNMTSFFLFKETDSVCIKIERMKNPTGKFNLYGAQFSMDNSGIKYHSIGVNGASVPSYLRCDYLMDQLKLVKPDLVIFSIGINDAYEPTFSSEEYYRNYDTLIQNIKVQYPNVNFIFTTNNDSYYKRKMVNERVFKAREVMYELAKDHDGIVWDFFHIMGGLNSIKLWEDAGLAKTDKIHLTTKGYKLSGDLFFEAFIKSYKSYIQKNG